MAASYAKRTRSGRSYGSVSQRLGAAAGVVARTAARAAMNYGRSRIQTALAKQSESSILSTQHDVSSRYRRKAMPRRRRKKWVGFVRKVNAVVQKAQGLSTYTESTSANLTSAVNSTGAMGVGLYNVGGDMNEVSDMFVDKYGAGIAPQTKLTIKSAVLDVTIANTGTALAIIDCYILVCRKPYSSAVSIDSQFTTNFNQQGTTSSKSVTNPAVTVFGNPNFCKYWKVLSKKEIMLGAGQVTTMQLRDARDRLVQGIRLTSEPQYLRGAKAYFFNFHGIPENNAGTARLAATALTWSYQKSYTYGIPPGQTTDNQHNA